MKNYLLRIFISFYFIILQGIVIFNIYNIKSRNRLSNKYDIRGVQLLENYWHEIVYELAYSRPVEEPMFAHFASGNKEYIIKMVIW